MKVFVIIALSLVIVIWTIQAMSYFGEGAGKNFLICVGLDILVILALIFTCVGWKNLP